MNSEFDYIGYVVKYGCKYNSGNTFLKDAFKTDYEQIVPIVHNLDDHRLCLGGATLEHRDDGVVAKCKFGIYESGRIAKELLESGKCDLSFLAIPVKRKGEFITSGAIRAVLFLDKHYKPSIVGVDVESDKEAWDKRCDGFV